MRTLVLLAIPLSVVACSSTNDSTTSSGSSTVTCASATCDGTKQYCEEGPDGKGGLTPTGCQDLPSGCDNCECLEKAKCPTTGVVSSSCSDVNGGITFSCTN